jgi:hypothetical protein
MFDLRNFNHSNVRATKMIPVGSYQSVVTNVQWRDDYRAETVFEISYELTSADGKKYQHSEIFENKTGNHRTREFFEYLVENGIYRIEDFEGHQEELEIRKDMKRGKTFSSICERKFLS